MNDRFKFRVWDIEDCSYICRNDFDDIWFDKDGELHIGMYSDFTQGIEDYTSQVIIEQCTGLKDKNGNLIYEGDILDCELQDIDSHGYPFIHFKKGVVKRAKNGAYCVEGDDDFYASDITLYPIEIIGNIHEQAE